MGRITDKGSRVEQPTPYTLHAARLQRTNKLGRPQSENIWDILSPTSLNPGTQGYIVSGGFTSNQRVFKLQERLNFDGIHNREEIQIDKKKKSANKIQCRWPRARAKKEITFWEGPMLFYLEEDDSVGSKGCTWPNVCWHERRQEMPLTVTQTKVKRFLSYLWGYKHHLSAFNYCLFPCCST